MTPEQVVDLLTKCAAFDQRTVGEGDVMAWWEALSDLDLADALPAVTRHYRESTDRMMPAHVRRLVVEIRRERHRLEREEGERLALEAEMRDRGPLTDRSADIAALLTELRNILPPGDPAALKPRFEYWAREYRQWQRQQDAEPNPHYRPELNAAPPEVAS